MNKTEIISVEGDTFTLTELEKLFPGDPKTQKLTAIFSRYWRAIDLCRVCWSPITPEDVEPDAEIKCGVCGSKKTLLSKMKEDEKKLILGRVFENHRTRNEKFSLGFNR